MKVIEHLEQAKHPLISFEIIPPKRGENIAVLEKVVHELARYKPPFIDVTSHAAEQSDGRTSISAKQVRKRPGTLGICALIQRKYNIDAVPHVLCSGFTQEETEDFLLEVHYTGIENVLALRGDVNGQLTGDSTRKRNEYALNLVQQLTKLKEGVYLEGDGAPLNFCVGVAGYPEKHLDANSLESDILYTGNKIRAGADYIVTQLFYDTNAYVCYVKQCREQGIMVPIIPGLKILTSKKQLSRLPLQFNITIPDELALSVEKAERQEEVLDLGVSWAVKQVEELYEAGAHAVHFYVMQNTKPIMLLMEKLRERKLVTY